MKKLPGFAVLAVALILASCASLFGGPTQDVAVRASNGKKASCRLVNNHGSWNVIAPATVEVKKSNSALKIYCASKKLKIKGAKLVKADKNGNYPAKVVIKLTRVKASDLPDGEQENEDLDSEPLNMLPEDPDPQPE